MKNITWEEWQHDKLLMGLTIALLIAFAAVLIMSIVVFVVYVKTSWIERENSKNVTGGDLARTILNEEGMSDVEIKPSYFYAKYWNHSKRKKTFRLRPWTVNRRSIWTMTEAAQQTVVSTWRRKKGRMGTAFTIFRIPTILSVISVILSIGTLIYVYLKFRTGDGLAINSSEGKKTIAILIIAFTVIATLTAWADVMKLSIIRKHVTPILQKQGFTEKEMRLFKLIYTSRLILAIAIALYNTIRLMLQIAASTKGEGGNK
ncbi:zinc metallopeptidase [Mycoplasma todarodis]|uniref:Uncharacterized protein n=1 Tax=Mycoplasma todarodis TaxID=1937191 RepID=A0A4R0XTK6_9MOLU|nr:zinc metallopeptidase [Mycoplasma todarodis]TCG11097.1 hypothetical protein C4B25_02285 [Mycoplasma todarodis]